MVSSYSIEQKNAVEARKTAVKRDILSMYITDALQVIEQNTERAYGGSHHSQRYIEIVEDMEKPRKTRSADDIVAHFNSIFLRKDDDREEVMDDGSA